MSNNRFLLMFGEYQIFLQQIIIEDKSACCSRTLPLVIFDQTVPFFRK